MHVCIAQASGDVGMFVRGRAGVFRGKLTPTLPSSK